MAAASSIKTRWRRIEAWLAALLTGRVRTRAAMVAVTAFALAGVLFLTGLKAAQDIFIDSAEAYAWGQQMIGGYGRHPPLTGWIAHIWYSVFPAADLASYALSRVMTFVTLATLYFIARRVAGPRRAIFVVLVMMLYPLFATKGERFNNYQVLLAMLPLLVLAFLRAYEKRNVVSGVLLGLSAAACTMTIYSGLIGVAAVGLAALIHRDRWRFLRSPAPWVAVVVYGVALIPHVLWLIKWHFPTLQWANSLAEQPGSVAHTFEYLGHHFALVGIPIVVGALLLLPWRLRERLNPTRHPEVAAQRPSKDARPMIAKDTPSPFEALPSAEHLRVTGHQPDAMLVLIISIVLVFTPFVGALVSGSYLRLDWGNPLFFLVPLTLLVTVPLRVTRRAVARASIVALGFTALLLAASPIYPWVNYRMRPVGGPHAPYHEIGVELTKLWRARFNTPLPIVVGGYETAAYVVFYSPDHPKMYADFDPALSSWIDYPSELTRKGWVGACGLGDAACLARLDAIDPNTEQAVVSVTRMLGGITGETATYAVRMAGPK